VRRSGKMETRSAAWMSAVLRPHITARRRFGDCVRSHPCSGRWDLHREGNEEAGSEAIHSRGVGEIASRRRDGQLRTGLGAGVCVVHRSQSRSSPEG